MKLARRHRTYALLGSTLLLAGLLMVSCGRGASSKEGDSAVRTIRQSGMERSYIVHLPPNVDSRRDWPVLMAFHPFFTTAEEFQSTSKLHEANGAENFIVVYPNGFRRSWNVGDCCGRAGKRNIDDVGFFTAIMEDLNENVAPVRDRAFITGFSNGGMMVYKLVCDQADKVAAAAPAGATIEMNSRTCNPSRDVPILHLHGARDEWAPLNGGKSEFDYVAAQPPVRSGLEYLAREESCSRTGRDTLMKDVDCETWTGCSGGSEVSLCIVPNLGHLWPGRDAVKPTGKVDLGPARTDINGSAAIVRFFEENL